MPRMCCLFAGWITCLTTSIAFSESLHLALAPYPMEENLSASKVCKKATLLVAPSAILRFMGYHAILKSNVEKS